MRRVLLLLLGIAFSSCTSTTQSSITRYHDDGRAKPILAIAPILDTTSFDVPWSISEELTSLLVEKVTQKNLVFVQSGEEFSVVDNPFSRDFSWMQREFPSQEFVAFLEIVEHEILPAEKTTSALYPQEVSQNLNVSIRLRVMDLRGTTPKVVLQEIVRDSYYIPKTLSPTNYDQVTWGTADYCKSSMGIAHAQIVQEIANRISEYVLLAKSR